MPELPVRDTIAGAYRRILDRRRAFVTALIFPIAILVVLNLSESLVWQIAKMIWSSSLWIGLGDYPSLRPSLLGLVGAISSALYLIPITYFGVAWETALSEERDCERARLSVIWRHAHTRFIRAACLLWFLALLFGCGYVIACAAMSPSFVEFLATPFSLYSPFHVAVFLLALMLGAYVFARLCFILPLSDEGLVVSIKDSLRRTKEQGERLVGIFFVALLPLVAAQFIVSSLWEFLSPNRKFLCADEELESRIADIVNAVCAMDLPFDLTAQTFQLVCMGVVLTVVHIARARLS